MRLNCEQIAVDISYQYAMSFYYIRVQQSAENIWRQTENDYNRCHDKPVTKIVMIVMKQEICKVWTKKRVLYVEMLTIQDCLQNSHNLNRTKTCLTRNTALITIRENNRSKTIRERQWKCASINDTSFSILFDQCR